MNQDNTEPPPHHAQDADGDHDCELCSPPLVVIPRTGAPTTGADGDAPSDARG